MPKNVFLVNGHGDSRDILRDVLRHHGYRVEDRHDSSTAVEEIRATQPDLVILELYLHPHSGDAIIARIKGAPETRHIPVICLTSRVMREDRQAALAAGADLFLPKPLAPSEVVARVRDLIGAAEDASVPLAGD